MATRASYRIELFKSTKDRQHYWRLRAANGNILATSEGYKRARSCKLVAQRMSKVFADSAIVPVIDLNVAATH